MRTRRQRGNVTMGRLRQRLALRRRRLRGRRHVPPETRVIAREVERKPSRARHLRMIGDGARASAETAPRRGHEAFGSARKRAAGCTPAARAVREGEAIRAAAAEIEDVKSQVGERRIAGEAASM